MQAKCGSVFRSVSTTLPNKSSVEYVFAFAVLQLTAIAAKLRTGRRPKNLATPTTSATHLTDLVQPDSPIASWPDCGQILASARICRIYIPGSPENTETISCGKHGKLTSLGSEQSDVLLVVTRLERECVRVFVPMLPSQHKAPPDVTGSES